MVGDACKRMAAFHLASMIGSAVMGMGHVIIVHSNTDRRKSDPGSPIRLFLDSSLDTMSSQLTVENNHMLIPKTSEDNRP